MLNGESGRLETKEPRDFTSAERKQLFLAWKRADAQRERLKREVEGWHEMDDVLTPDQIAETPRPCG
jgi:hypothetical protein